MGGPSRLTSRHASPSGSIAQGQGLGSPHGLVVISIEEEEKKKKKYSNLPPALQPLQGVSCRTFYFHPLAPFSLLRPLLPDLLLQADASAVFTTEAKKKRVDERPRGARGGSDFMRLAYVYEERNVEDFQVTKTMMMIMTMTTMTMATTCAVNIHLPHSIMTLPLMTCPLTHHLTTSRTPSTSSCGNG